MFFLEKNDVEEFQSRCIVALFLDNHDDVKFEEYIGENHIRGIVKDQQEDIFLFNTPSDKGKSGVVYRAINQRKTSGFQYFIFDPNFIDEYRKFANNSYEYIKNNFVEKQWESKYVSLFVSNPPKTDELYKYKSNPSDDDDKSLNLFKDFLNRKLTFVNPTEMNDPFDCDCEIAMNDSLSILLYKAISKTKYGNNSAPKINLDEIERGFLEVEKEHIDYKYLSDEDIRRILRRV